MSENKDPNAVRDFVRERYAGVAQQATSCCGSTPTPGAGEGFAEKLGYGAEELASLPEGANLGLSCGNPVALATLAEGETLIDLGSGGGFDCFIAGRKVGAAGRVIGVDMTPDMISRARSGVAQYRDHSGLDNVEFRLGEIEHLPAADSTADVVISNCVLNLSPEKPQVWREIGRVLKPGGRVAISDVALLKPLPESLREDLRLLSACLAGAVTIEQYVAQVEAAGLSDVDITPKEGGDKIWENYKDPLLQKVREQLPEGARIGDYAVSVNVTARKRGAEISEPVAAASEAGSSCCS